MSYTKQSFGMMDEGYFVPRGEILNWINDLLKLNITKIQQLGSGAVYCQIVDVIHPGKVALSKVNWKAKNDYQFINNLKVLQNAFDKIGIKRHVEVEKLAKAKYQDNLQFIQWLKRYYDLNCGERGSNYNAQERRGAGQVDLSFADKTVVPKTYNASGVIKNESTLPQKAQKVVEKKKVPTSSSNLAPKAQQGPARVKSPAQTKRIQKTQQSSKKIEPAKVVPKAVKTSTTKKEQKIEKVEEEGQGVTNQVNNEAQNEKNHLLELQLKQAFTDLEESRAQNESYRNKLKNVEMKLQMIKEILSTQDDASMKVSLIEEIFKQ